MVNKLNDIINNIITRLKQEFSNDLNVRVHDGIDKYEENIEIDVFNIPRDRFIDFIEFSSKVCYEEALIHDVFVDIIPHKAVAPIVGNLNIGSAFIGNPIEYLNAFPIEDLFPGICNDYNSNINKDSWQYQPDTYCGTYNYAIAA